MPSKGKRAAGPEEAFLFVNEDFGTLFGGAKNLHLDRTKQSHVQRQSFAKRTKSTKSGKTSTPKSPTPSDSGRSPASSSPGPSIPRTPSESHPSTLYPSSTQRLWLAPQEAEAAPTQSHPLDAPTEGQQFLLSDIAISSQRRLDISRLQRVQTENLPIDTDRLAGDFERADASDLMLESGHLFQTYPQSSTPNDFDPFINFNVALGMWAPPLMRHFTLIMVPEYFHADLKTVGLHEMRHVEELHADMRSCMSNPAEMYALLAASASHSMGRSGRLELAGLVSQDYDRVTLLLTSKAFGALRHRLSNGALTHNTVMATQRMVCAALYTSTLSAVEAHYRAAMSMIEQIGGLDTFNDYQKELLIMHNLHYALKTRRAPDFELIWDPGSFQRNTSFEVFSSVMAESIFVATHIRAIAETSELDLRPDVAQAILDLVEVQQVSYWLYRRPYRPADYRWLMQRRLAIMHRLLSTQSDTGTTSSSLVRFALISYIILSRVFSCSETLLPAQHTAPDMRLWSADTLEHAFEDAPEMLLWIMVLFGILLTPKPGRNTASEKADLTDASRSVRDAGRRACEAACIATESQLRATLGRMLFDDEIVDERYLMFVENSLGLEMD